VRLACASAAALALELALIRWLPANVRVLAYFPNVVLIASFLGLGLGAMWKRATLAATAGGLVVVVVAAALLSRVAFTASSASEHLWLLYYDLPHDAPVVHGVILPVFLVFLLVTVSFLGLGAAVARGLAAYQGEDRALRGYVADLVGSLIGVAAFAGLAALRTRPIAWFAVALALALLAAASRAERLWLGACATVILLLVTVTDHADRYSPYYALRTVRAEGHFEVLANGSLHQYMLDLREGATGSAGSGTALVRQGMRLPLLNLRHPPRRALVLGAGTGNDVSILLEAGVPEIHAVEIDPEILDIGRRLHPARPYADARVITHVGDARAFLERTDLRFDYIVIGTLDSMTRLSALSNVRLDNFVYTRESLEAARAHLTDDGGLALFFLATDPDIEDHLYAILDQAFGREPLTWRSPPRLFNRTYLAGPGFSHLEGRVDLVDADRSARRDRLVAPSDDWPFLYLDRPRIPALYLQLAALVLASATAGVLGVSRAMRGELASGRVDVEMMLFGAAFLLLESSFVTDMNLLFGATWRTSVVVFASILVAVLAATLLAQRVRIRAAVALPIVAVVLLVLSQIPLRSVAPADPVARLPFALLTCGVPVALAALAFADRFRMRSRVEIAFGWNLLGAVCGGLLEFMSMATGLRALFLAAAALYLLVLLLVLRRPREDHFTLGSSSQ
jgi:spermidine synthase